MAAILAIDNYKVAHVYEMHLMLLVSFKPSQLSKTTGHKFL